MKIKIWCEKYFLNSFILGNTNKDGVTIYNEKIIDFERNDKRFYKSARYDTTSDGITMKELQAINKKCQELGWI